ncbi:hypothetical protein ACFL60_03930 [Candidatus Omnitrophota bacterium]
MRNLIILMPLIITCFISCSEDSPLSDTGVTDPSLIKPVIQLYSHRNSGSAYKTERVEVFLYDKNNNTVRLKNGGVYINDQKMIVKDLLFSSGTYYSGIEVIPKIETNKSYSIKIELDDDSPYYADITTQAKDLVVVNAPDKHSKSNDLQISWEDIDPDLDLTLVIGIHYTKEGQGAYEGKILTIPDNNLTTGDFTISSAYFNAQPNTYSITVELVSEISGQVDKAFMNGSKVTSIFSVSSEVEIE